LLGDGGGEGGHAPTVFTEMHELLTPNDSSQAGFGSVDVTRTVVLIAVCGIVISTGAISSRDQVAVP
jgi:hypothetical protein